MDSDFVYNEYIYFNITDSNYKNTADFGGTNETNNFYAIEYSVDGGVTYTTRNYCNLKISHIYIGKTIKFRLSHERDGACEGSFEATTPTIKKADYDYTLPSGKKGEYGEALSEVVLGGDSYYGTFTWTDGTEVINTMGTFTSTITFTPSESYADRYNTITNIPLTITVEKGSVYQSTMDEKAIKNDQTSMQFDIEKVPTNIINPTFGTVEVLNNKSLTNTQTIDSTGKISLTFNDLTDITDTTIGYKVKVVSDSYNDFYVRFSVKVTAKDIQSALTVATSDAKTTYVYGEAIQLVVGGGSGTGAISYAVTSGTATIDASGKVTGANVGDIVIKATKAGDDTYNAISQNITITITALEKTVVWSNLTAEQLIYDGNAKAYTAKIVGVSGNDIALSVAYTIKDTSTVESPINAQAYTATATLTADSNYSLANKTLDFTITPASASAYPNYAVPTGITATYGNTLEDVTLPASWSFDSALETAVGDYGNRTFAVTFDPVSTNYTAVGATVTIAVSKASGINASDYSVPTGLTATYGDTLADITLPTGWSFDRALTTAVGEAGTNTFSATFTSTNANYNVATQDVSIDVSKLALAKPTMASTSQNYNGQDITFVISGLDNTTMQTDSDSNSLTVKNAGNYAVYISLVDLNNYMWEDSSTSRVTLSYTINKVAITQDMIDTFVSSYKYTGSAITVTVNAKSGDILTDTDFEVCEYQNNIDVGTATFSIRAKADTNFNGGVSQTFSITQADNEWLADPSIEDWAFVATANVPDLGQVKFGTPYAKYTQITEQGNQSLGTTVPNTMGAYILTVVVDETDNFKGLTKDVAFNITEAITNKPTANTTVFTYNGTDQTYLPVGFNSATMAITNNIQTNAGTYSVTVAPISTYEWSDGTNSAMEFSFVIAKAQPTVDTIAITATEGQKISDITLPSGWTFKEGTDLSASVGSVGNGASINIVLPETQNYVGTSQTVIITVQIDEAKAQALATAKTAKIAEINTLKATYNQADYRAEDWATIEAMFADAIQNINKASNLTNVESAVNLATIKTNANAVKTDSELTAEATKPTSPDDDGNKPTIEDSNKNSNLGLALGLGLGLPLGLIAIVVALLFLNKFGILGIAIIDKQKWLAFFHNSKKLHASAPILSPNEDIITPTNQSNNQETDSKDTNTKDTDS